MPVEPTLSELKAEIYYVATLRHGADEVELEVEEVSELNLTGEGEVPLTTRLGDLSLNVVVTARLLEVLNRVGDYRDVSVELIDVTNGRCLFAGVGDRAGWSTDITDASRTADLAFVSKLAVQDTTDVHDPETNRAYDTLSWSEALDVVGDLADVPVFGSPEDLEFDNVSVCRRVTSRLAGADYAVGERVGGLAVIPTGIAVGVSNYVMWTNGMAYLPLAKIWYKNTGHDFDAEVGGRAWTVVALGYRDGQLHGLVGLVNLGIVARFSCSATPAIYGNWPAVMITGADCFRWWFDLCAVRGSFTQWKIYGGDEAAIWSIYAVGTPTPDTTKELGVPKVASRLEGTTNRHTLAQSNYVGVVNPGPLSGARVGDVVDVEDEFCGTIVRLDRTGNVLWIFFNHKLFRDYNIGSDVYVYKQDTLPTNNLLLARPVPVKIHYHDPWQWGGSKVCDVKGLRRRHLAWTGSRFYAPVTVDDVDGVTVGPGYVTLQTEADLIEYVSKVSYSPTPRNFDAYLPGRCVFPPDVAHHIEYRQSRLRGGKYADQGPVRIHSEGSALGNNEADGAVVTAPRYRWPEWEDWKYGKYLTIKADAASGLLAGHQFFYDATDIEPYYSDGRDIRVIYKNDNGVWVELDRDIPDPKIFGLDGNKRYVVFGLTAAVAAGTTVGSRYAVIWRTKYPGPLKTNRDNIYLFHHDCETKVNWNDWYETFNVVGGEFKAGTGAVYGRTLNTADVGTDVTVYSRVRSVAGVGLAGIIFRGDATTNNGWVLFFVPLVNAFFRRYWINVGWGENDSVAYVCNHGVDYIIKSTVIGNNFEAWISPKGTPIVGAPMLAWMSATGAGNENVGFVAHQSINAIFDDIYALYAVTNEPTITAGDRYCNSRPIVVWEDLAWREEDNHRYPVLRIGAVNADGKLVRLWQNRDPRDPHATPEYYISSALVDRGGKIYGAIRVRERVWENIEATVIAVGPDEATKFEPGSLPLMFNNDISDLVEIGDEIRVGTRSPAIYTVAEIAPRWQILTGDENHVCDNLGAYNGPATILGLSDVDGITGGELATEVMKARFCGQKLKLATSVREYWAVYEFDPGGPTFTIKNELVYNTGWPKIDEEAEFARENIMGETLEPADDAPLGWALYKAENRNPLDETHVRVLANRRGLDVVDVAGRLSLPAPEDGNAYVDWKAGDAADELWIYLPDRYLAADVVARYDYYPDVPITAVWLWDDDIYFGSGDGYIWRLDGTLRTCVGRFPDGDYPVETVVDDDTTWLLTAAGRLAKHDRYHSGCVEGDFGGDDQDLFHLVAEIARASGTPVRETPDGLRLGKIGRVNLEEHDVVHVGERPARDIRALEVEYSDGSVVAGNAKAKAEQTASLPTPLVYTPQHAKVIAEIAWARLASSRRRVILEGISADPMVVALATEATYSNSVYDILRLGILQNDYRLEARDVTPSIATPTLPKTEAD